MTTDNIENLLGSSSVNINRLDADGHDMSAWIAAIDMFNTIIMIRDKEDYEGYIGWVKGDQIQEQSYGWRIDVDMSSAVYSSYGNVSIPGDAPESR